jgi:1-acyl-sn-glycerol-3-phosphate acyltransferase
MVLFAQAVTGFASSSQPRAASLQTISFSDSIFMPLVVLRKVTFMAKSEYFTPPAGIKGFIKKITFQALGQVPAVDRLRWQAEPCPHPSHQP